MVRIWFGPVLSSMREGGEGMQHQMLHTFYSNFRNYAPPIFTVYMSLLFYGSFCQYSWVGEARLKDSLMLQHIIYHPLKS